MVTAGAPTAEQHRRGTDLDDIGVGGEWDRDAVEAAAAAGQITAVYQPIYDLSDGTWSGSETLARWEHPARGMVSPEEFVPALEASGSTFALARAMIGAGAAQQAAWQASMGDAAPAWVSVNVSAHDLAHDELLSEVIAAVTANGIAADQMVVELTETAVMSDGLRGAAALDLIKAYGARVAVDDFGAGYSSLSHLFHLPLDMLKLDRVFLANHNVPAQRAVIEAIVGLAHRLGITVVAEGVETAEQYRLVRDLGCEYAQGYLLARPVPSGQTPPRTVDVG